MTTAAPHARGDRACVLLRAAGASVVLDASGPGLPAVLHWGPTSATAACADLAAALACRPVPHSALDVPVRARAAARAGGWSGAPGTVPGAARRPRLVAALSALDAVDVDDGPGGGASRARRRDRRRAGRCVTELRPRRRTGVLRVAARLRNAGADAVRARRAGRRAAGAGGRRPSCSTSPAGGAASAPAAAPLPRRAPGCATRRRGRTGHDATLLLVAGTAGFGFRHGEVWGVHVAWSGDHAPAWAERLPDGRAVLGGGELLGPGEVGLAPGRVATATPWRARGLVRRRAGRAQRRGCTRHVRARPPAPAPPAAGGAQHLGGRLLRPRPRPADRAGRRRRRGRRGAVRARRRLVPRPPRRHAPGSATGTSTRPSGRDGLHPLVDHVRGLGMEFGLWVEPEMVNPDSDLSARTPTGCCAGRRRLPPRGGTSRCSTWQPGGVRRTCSDRLDALLDRVPTSATSSGTTTATCSRPAHDGRPGGARADAWRSTGCSTSCAAATRARDRVLLVRRRPGRPRRSWSAPTGSGPATATTRWSGRRSSAGPRCCCRPSWSAATSARRARTPPAARTTWAFRARPRCSATSASSGTSAALAERAGRAGRAGRALQASCGPAALRRRRARRPPGPGGACTAWWRPTGPRRCSPTCS